MSFYLSFDVSPPPPGAESGSFNICYTLFLFKKTPLYSTTPTPLSRNVQVGVRITQKKSFYHDSLDQIRSFYLEHIYANWSFQARTRSAPLRPGEWAPADGRWCA
jgi:hypothetical protein